jgi:hypothetical protein
MKNNQAQGESPLLQSSNPLRKLDKAIKKDSCIDLKIGR